MLFDTNNDSRTSTHHPQPQQGEGLWHFERMGGRFLRVAERSVELKEIFWGVLLIRKKVILAKKRGSIAARIKIKGRSFS